MARQPTPMPAPPWALPMAMSTAFCLMGVTGMIWTPFAPGFHDWLIGATGAEQAAENRPGIALGTVTLLPLLLTAWISLRLLPQIRRMRSTDMLKLGAIAASSALAWYLTGPIGSPEVSFWLALGVSWFILINRPAK